MDSDHDAIDPQASAPGPRTDRETAHTPGDTLPSPQEMADAVAMTQRVLAELDRLLLGRQDFHRQVLVGILSRGHILLEGVPGVGKTALIKALGEILQLDFKRVQFTPDLMPSDILGSHLLQPTADGERQMVFQPGPIFTQILLADEINRASPKTQSALLEAMQERSVTLHGTSRQLPRPFFVMASQNPIELEGTYPLPEAQLDRFLFKLTVGAPSAEVLQGIITSRRRGEPPAVQQHLSQGELEHLFTVLERIYLPTPVARYIARLVAATHPGPQANEVIRRHVRYGASPRAAIAMAEAARATALLDGRPTVGFEDVQRVAPAVLEHRLILNYQASFDGIGSADLVDQLLRDLEVAELGLDGALGLAGGTA